MKIVLALIIVAVVLPLGLSIATAYIMDITAATTGDSRAAIEIFSFNLTSEPVTMILIGMGLIAIASIGRKKLIKKNNPPK